MEECSRCRLLHPSWILRYARVCLYIVSTFISSNSLIAIISPQYSEVMPRLNLFNKINYPAALPCGNNQIHPGDLSTSGGMLWVAACHHNIGITVAGFCFLSFLPRLRALSRLPSRYLEHITSAFSSKSTIS